MTVKRSYFICFTVRSGSTLLCQLLQDTGLAGKPRERFYHGISPENPSGDEIADYRRYLSQVLAADTTPNGVFGAKIGGGCWKDFARRLRSIDGMGRLPLRAALDSVFPDLRYLHLSRRNKVRQAVSHWRAIQSGRWSSLDAASNPPSEYDFAAIDHLLQEIIMRDAVWAEYFAANQIRPLVITYEDFVQEPSTIIRDIFHYLEIEIPVGFNVPAPTYQRLADDLSEEWVERFRREKQADWWTAFW